MASRLTIPVGSANCTFPQRATHQHSKQGKRRATTWETESQMASHQPKPCLAMPQSPITPFAVCSAITQYQLPLPRRYIPTQMSFLLPASHSRISDAAKDKRNAKTEERKKKVIDLVCSTSLTWLAGRAVIRLVETSRVSCRGYRSVDLHPALVVRPLNLSRAQNRGYPDCLTGGLALGYHSSLDFHLLPLSPQAPPVSSTC